MLTINSFLPNRIRKSGSFVFVYCEDVERNGHRMKRAFSFLIAFVFIMSIPIITTAEEDCVYTITEPHVYPIKPGTDAWGDLNGAIEKRHACSVSVEEVMNMTTSALADTVINYPLLVDMYAYDTIEQGINAVNQYFPGLKEFINRPDALPYLQQISCLETKRNENTDIRYYFSDTLIKVINSLGENISSETNSSHSFRKTSVSLRSPMDWYNYYNNITDEKNVEAYTGTTWTDHGTSYTQANSLSLWYQTVYNVTPLAGVDPDYNCHSYAWYWHSTSNPYWIGSPLQYIIDSSYYQQYYPGNGCIITYPTPTGYNHSGIVTSVSGNNIMVESKWGYFGLFLHNETECPYYNSYISNTYWSINPTVSQYQ